MEIEGIGSEIAEGLGSAPAAPAAAIEPSASALPAPAPESSASAAKPVATQPASQTPAAPTPASATPPATPAPDDKSKPQESIPLSVALDWRDELKKTKAELADLKKQPATPAAAVPSFKDNPDEFAAYLADQTNRTAMSTRFDVSELTAREKHGDETVSSAMDWGMQRSQQSPAFAAEYLKQKNPIDWIVKQQKRTALHDEIDTDPDAYVRKRATELGFVAAAAAPAAPAASQASAQATVPAPQQHPASQATPAPTRSLASAPSAGGPQTVPTGPFAAFDALPIGP